jgi:hypothetical protein
VKNSDRKKNYKKGLQVSVNRDIMDSNKEAAMSGEGETEHEVLAN